MYLYLGILMWIICAVMVIENNTHALTHALTHLYTTATCLEINLISNTLRSIHWHKRLYPQCKWIYRMSIIKPQMKGTCQHGGSFIFKHNAQEAAWVQPRLCWHQIAVSAPLSRQDWGFLSVFCCVLFSPSMFCSFLCWDFPLHLDLEILKGIHCFAN